VGAKLARDALAALGEPVMEGVLIATRSGPDDHQAGAYVALTASRLVIFSTVKRQRGQEMGAQIASFFPGELDRFEFGTPVAGATTMDIVAVTGERWCFECSTLTTRKLTWMAETTRAQVVWIG
jgi:hypothetical protein